MLRQTKIKLLLFIFTAFFSCEVFCQENFIYLPLANDESLKKSIQGELLARYNADINSLENSDYKKEITAVYKERYELLKKYADEGRIITDTSLNNYIQSISNEILSANPEVKALHTRVFLCTDYWPNAACYGEGTILFNIGLLNRLHNEAEVAFVICHEMAHQYFNHNNNAINTYFETINYAGGQISTDKINLKTEAKSLIVLPGKTGSVIILEYYKKQKKIDLYVEKMN